MDIKTRLITSRLDTGTVEIPGVGTITVRALSRDELLSVGKLEAEGPLAMERYTIARAMVDPPMSEDEVAAWQKASPANELNAVTDKVNELSGITPSAAKEAYKSAGGEPGPGV